MASIEEIGLITAAALANPYSMAIVVPIAFYSVGAFSKKIIRDGSGGSFFALSDWYLAPDAMLVTVGSMLAQLTDLLSKFDPTNHHGKIRGTVVLTAFSVCLYLVILALHRHYENVKTTSGKSRFFWLVVVANVISLSVMGMWLVAIKGVDNA